MNEIVIRIEGLDELTKALYALAKIPIGETMAQNVQQPLPVPQMPYSAQPAQSVVPVQASTVPVQQPIPSAQPPVQQSVVPAQPPVQQMAAPQQPVPQVPITAAPEQYSFDQLAVALSNVCGLPNGQPQVHALLQQFGVNALFDLPKEKYGEFATALRGIGGVI